MQFQLFEVPDEEAPLLLRHAHVFQTTATSWDVALVATRLGVRSSFI